MGKKILIYIAGIATGVILTLGVLAFIAPPPQTGQKCHYRF
jgi:hypothetical protein